MSQPASTPGPEDEYARLGPTNRTATLFLVSVLALFVELLLIRWIGTEIRIFAYLQNTVLVTCFLGLGMGCLTCRKPVVLRQFLVPMVVLALLLGVPFSRVWLGNITELLTAQGDFLIWSYGVQTRSRAMVMGGGPRAHVFAPRADLADLRAAGPRDRPPARRRSAHHLGLFNQPDGEPRRHLALRGDGGLEPATGRLVPGHGRACGDAALARNARAKGADRWGVDRRAGRAGSACGI